MFYSESISIIAADDLEAHRRRLNRIITAQPDMELLGIVSSGAEAIRMVDAFEPDVVLLDIEMENATAGITAAIEIHKRHPHCKIIMLTVHDSDDIVFQAFQEEIANYLVKTLPPEQIAQGIRDAYYENVSLQADISQKLTKEFRRIKTSEDTVKKLASCFPKLTSSEQEVVHLLYNGLSKRQIAESRVVEMDTIKKQVNSILKKFSMTSIDDVIALIERSGMAPYLFRE